MRCSLGFLGVLLMYLVIPMAAFSAPADGEKRVALIIGNSAYKHSTPLSNPVRDARLMSTTLKQAGFEVVDGFDLGYGDMHATINRFAEVSYDADVSLIYYAGHGMQINGKNYLVPVDAELKSPAHLKTRTIQVDDLLGALPPDPAVGVIILDACRDNPLTRTLATFFPQSRSGSLVGLATVEVKSGEAGTGGVIIAYATDPGAIAYDGGGANSPYTAALARHLVEPDLEIQSALTRVRGEVTLETNGKQRPWHNASLGREVYLGGRKPAELAAPAPAPEPLAENDISAVEKLTWEEASKRNTLAHYEAYLKQYPDGAFADLARLNSEQLKAAEQVAALAEPTADATGEARLVLGAPPPQPPEDVGSEVTEAAIGLDRRERIDVQERLSALGFDLDEPDGAFGGKTRKAIGNWQSESGLASTTYLTRKQYLRLKQESQELIETYRAEREAAKDAERKEQEAAKAEERRQQQAREEERRQNATVSAEKKQSARKQREQARADRQRESRKKRAQADVATAKPQQKAAAPAAKNKRVITCRGKFGALYYKPLHERCWPGDPRVD